MKQGHLSQYFTGIAVKHLSAVEADVLVSNQHEFNGVEALKLIFGNASWRQQFPAKFVYLSDRNEEAVVADGFLTWYDARDKHPKRTEHRLYFPTTVVSELAAEGDLLRLDAFEGHEYRRDTMDRYLSSLQKAIQRLLTKCAGCLA